MRIFFNTAPQAQEFLDVTHRTANATIGRLEKAHIVQQVPEREHPRQYVAGEILRILEEDLSYNDTQVSKSPPQ